MTTMKWLWNNTAQIGFGENAVKDHLSKFIKEKSKILCTFGGGSIEKNGAKSDVETVLKALKCTVRWEGGILPNPEYDRLMEIVEVVREFQPDLILSVGGGSVLDGTKFIGMAAKQPKGTDCWESICVKFNALNESFPVGSVMTLPATGSEWNYSFVISRRSIGWKVGVSRYSSAYPIFSLLDPKYTMTLPVRQLRNGIFDAFCHCVDSFLTPYETPMFDNFWMSVCKELVDISLPLLQPNSSIDLHGRLIMAASFACNFIFGLGQPQCWAIHMIGHILTAQYGIDHGSSLAMVMPNFLETQFEARKVKYAKMAEFVFGVKSGSVEEKAHKLIENIRKWVKELGIPNKVSEWEGAKIQKGDIDVVTKKIFKQSALGGSSFGVDSCATEPIVREVLKKVII